MLEGFFLEGADCDCGDVGGVFLEGADCSGASGVVVTAVAAADNGDGWWMMNRCVLAV